MGLRCIEPSIGQASILHSFERDSANHIQLLEKVITEFPAEHSFIIEDNPRIHVSRKVQLALTAWANIEILFISKYACWLNLIESWWKELCSLALKGMRFENLDELKSALDYWNIHRHPYVWKKEHQEQVALLGGHGVCKNPEIAVT